MPTIKSRSKKDDTKVLEQKNRSIAPRRTTSLSVLKSITPLQDELSLTIDFPAESDSILPGHYAIRITASQGPV